MKGKKPMKTPLNIVKFRLNGFPLDALDQKRMRRLRRTSDRMGVPIPDLILGILGQMIDVWIAEAELPNKIVKFQRPYARVENKAHPSVVRKPTESASVIRS
jgi:hypothetical protein